MQSGYVKSATETDGHAAQNDLRLLPSEYGETQVSTRRTDIARLNVQRTGANLGHEAAFLPEAQ
jgi:hypothetical protein